MQPAAPGTRPSSSCRRTERLSGPGRVVITATHSAAQKYATVFPEYFVKAMKEASTDLDKNGRTSIFEVFTAAPSGLPGTGSGSSTARRCWCCRAVSRG